MNEELKKYFLGTLSQTEIEEIELRLISDAAFEDELLLVRENLMEDYLDELLSPDEAENFKTNFLNSPDHINEVKTLAALKIYARGNVLNKTAAERAEKSANSFFDKLSSFFTLNLRWITAAIVILTATLFGYLFLNSDNNELADLNSRDFENINEYKNLTNLSLISGTLRSSDQISTISVEKLTDTVFLRLALPIAGEFFDVNIIENEKKIVSDLRVRAYSNQNGREIRLLLPSAILTPGNYKIEVFPADTTNTPVTYSFAVR